jgi:AraC-like DNA-binding protein
MIMLRPCVDRPGDVLSTQWGESDDASAHVERVLTIAEGHPSAPSDGEVATSWQRSANAHHIDPASCEPPRILTHSEIKDLREPLTSLIIHAQDELDQLYGIVRHARYTVLLCNDQGVAVDHRGNEAEASEFKYWGTWLGGVWSEQVEGTNGIGTCIAEERPITVHQGQHFRARNISLSCSGAPIFDSDGKLAAVLDVSSIDPHLSEQSHALTGALTEASARAIEERSFRERFRREWIAAIAPSDGASSAMLLAVDRHHSIVGANRRARTVLSGKGHDAENGISLWAIFERNPRIFRNKHRGDFATSLVPAGTSQMWPALITPPEATSGPWRSSETAGLHTRPRHDVLGNLHPPAPDPQARGGLPPRALRRVKEYIDSNLETSIDLAALADTAGLSMFHFARAFKQSEGITPHGYLLERRVERAQKLLATTNLSLSKIAHASGFADQSHLARHFRSRVGVSPSMFRWSRR